MKQNRTWIAFANRKRFRHADAIREIGYVNWLMGRRYRFLIGDVVYLFMSDERRIRFKMRVAEKNCKRTDAQYWEKKVPNDETYKLVFVQEYHGKLLDEHILKEHGFSGGRSIENPCCNNKVLIDYIDAVFDSIDMVAKPMSDLLHRPMLIVDLNSGSYLMNRIGHEALNLVKNMVDGRFYGYCPPHDSIEITKLSAAASDESVSGVTIVYTAKHNNTSNREILAFCENATVHRNGLIDKNLKRIVVENSAPIHCSYSIESDTLVDLARYEPKFVINVSEYNVYMFRRQRVYKGSYPELDRKILLYLQQCLKATERDDDFSYQDQIQQIDEVCSDISDDTVNTEPQYMDGGAGNRVVRKNPRMAKLSLARARYMCAVDAEHITFTTNKGVPYMEGHHLIPCTYTNARHYWASFQRNIDSPDNIICLCPTCHRKIHYASAEEKRQMLAQLYNTYQERLFAVGVQISLEDLYKLYGV